jgi:uncharacterized protein YndB with AHSA1/START domain
MPERSQHGYLVFADISGYTSYVSATEIEHANEILSDLLEVISGGLIPPLTLAKLEGDAVFAYGADSAVPGGEGLLDLIDATYVAFRDHLDGMRRRTTCECNACRAIPMLDLKFLVHHGEYLVQRMTVGQDLLGSDVNLIHRLAKNRVTETTGWRAYVLCTEAAAAALGLDVQELHQEVEEYEHLAPIRTFSYDLTARYTAMVNDRRVTVDPQDADVVIEQTVQASPPVVWTWLNDPVRLAQWMGADDVKAGLRPSGRTGVGARNHCIHGKNAVIQTVLDWRPFEYVTIESKGPVTQQITYFLQPRDAGTLVVATARMESGMPRMMSRIACRATYRFFKVKESLARMAELAEAEASSEMAEAV